jgi:hypothetical protein
LALMFPSSVSRYSIIQPLNHMANNPSPFGLNKKGQLGEPPF